MRIPNWIRIIVLVSAVMQLVFGLTVLIDPSQIKTVWPWPLPHLSARLLGASTLVSAPMAILSVCINRFVVAAIPFAMMMTYRVLQLAAGLIHLDRFDLATPLSLNYFGGGFMMMLLFGYVLWAGLTRRLPVASESAPFVAKEPWKPGKALRWTFGIVALVYTVLGVAFLLLGKNAAPFWIDAAGMTPLTARLFSSPLIGLGLGLFLVSRALDWRSVFVPAIGMVTIGVTGTLAMIIERKDLVAANAIAVIVILTPVVLLTIGCVILLLRPQQYTRRGQESL